MDYSLIITQRTAEGEGRVEVFAEGTVAENNVRLTYSLDGAEYELSLTAGSMRQTRRGEVSLDMLFSEGERTGCTLSHGASQGVFEIFTKRLEVSFLKQGFDAECIFEDGGGTTALTLSARAINKL